MSSSGMDDVKEEVVSNDASEEQIDDDEKSSDAIEDHSLQSFKQEEEVIRKKYGGLLPKKPPLISKDHERAFFDSADWALGKQGAQKPKGPLEALRPKLQPTPHQQVRMRRPAYASGDNTQEDENDKNVSLEDQSCSSASYNNSLENNSGDGDIKGEQTTEKQSVERLPDEQH